MFPMRCVRLATSAVVSVFLVLLLACGASAQGSGSTLVGRVTDQSRAAVRSAHVVAVNDETGLSRSAISGEDGTFVLPSLPPGPYRVSIEATGFSTVSASRIVLEADQVRRFDVQLTIGTVRQEIVVAAAYPLVRTETPAKSEVVPSLLVQALPLNGRNYVDLVLLVPGVYRRVGDDEADGVATNGTRPDAASFALDGLLNRSDRNGNSGVPVAVDAVREFSVETSTYAAEFGRSAGAQVNVVSKSGTNRFAGSVYDYVRDDRFDARSPFTPADSAPALTRQQGGATLGGPAWRDHTFFFGAYERLRERRSQAANSTAPHAAWLSGDFRNVRGSGPDGVFGNTDDTNRILDPLTREEFAVPNVIPASMFDPIARRILPLVPHANIAGTLEGYAAQGIARDDRQQSLIRLDHRLLAATNLSIRWARSSGTGFDPFPSQRVFFPGFGRTTARNLDSVSIAGVTAIGGRWLNEARLALFRQHVETQGQRHGTNYVSELGLTGLTDDRAVWGYPTIRIDGYSEFGDRPNDPSTYTLQNVQFRDTVSWTPGRHTIKAGVDLIRSKYAEQDLRGIRGDFRFRGRATNTATQTSSGFRSFADFLLGYIDQSQRQIGSDPARLSAWQAAGFIQDDWRPLPSLTVSVGVRYERESPLREQNNRLANFVPALGGVVLAGDRRFPAALVNTDSHGVAPRAGFAWRPFGDARTVVRGGIGLHHSLEQFNVTRQQLAVSYPFVQREQYTRTGDPKTAIVFSDPFPAGRAAIQGINQPFGMAVDFRMPRITEFNVAVERRIGAATAVELAYVGSRGRHLGRRYNLNQPIPIGINASGVLVTAVPYPAFADIQFQDQAGTSSYDALQVTLRRRVAGGLTLLASYTLGRAIDNGSTSTGNVSNVSTTGTQKAPQDIYNLAAERGPSDFDRRHQFSAAFAYDLPFGAGRRWMTAGSPLVNAIVGDWQVSGIVTLLSGRPFTVQYAAGDFATQRPDQVFDPTSNVPPGLSFNPAAFTRPVVTSSHPNLYGNAPRNGLRGPDYRTVDAAIAKSVPVGRWVKAQLRIEAFNLFNRANYQVPVFLLDRTDAGRVTSTTGNARELQFAARIAF
jgi:hypothetical protein